MPGRSPMIASPKRGAARIAHRRDVAERDRQAVARREHRLRQGLGVAPGACARNTMRCDGRLDVAAADQLGGAPGGARRLRGQSVGEQLLRIDHHLALALGAAKELHLRNPGTPRICGLITQRTSPRSSPASEPVARKAEVHEDIPSTMRAATAAADRRRRGRTGGFRQPLGDHLALPVRIAAAVEHHLDRR